MKNTFTVLNILSEFYQSDLRTGKIWGAKRNLALIFDVTKFGHPPSTSTVKN
jgi:hypothetical protein